MPTYKNRKKLNSFIDIIIGVTVGFYVGGDINLILILAITIVAGIILYERE